MAPVRRPDARLDAVFSIHGVYGAVCSSSVAVRSRVPGATPSAGWTDGARQILAGDVMQPGNQLIDWSPSIGSTVIYPAVVEPSKIAQVLGLRRQVTSLEQLDQQVKAGLPKASLGAVARHVYGTSPDAAALMQRVIPSATFHRRGEDLKPQEGERVERLARVIATAEHVWDSVDDARSFLSTGHAMLGGQRPIEVALTELGARRVENLLWSLFHGVAA